LRFWFDTEFMDDGRTIDLISIGIVADDGREYYAESNECDLSRANDWLRANVLPRLVLGSARSRKLMAKEIRAFVGYKPELWAYYADYDWVALCQLYGSMIDLPQGWPNWCRDVKQLCVDKGDPRLPKSPTREHNALADARWNREAWQYLMELESVRQP
jgi:hypothetical protein